MKTIVVSDLHGLAFKPIYNKIKANIRDIQNIILLGDYVDSFDPTITSELQINRLNKLVEIAKNDNRVKLLLGNHDLLYCSDREDRIKYRSFQKNYADIIGAIYKSNKELFSIVFQDDKYVYSHAGIHKQFMENNNFTNIEQINDLWKNYDIEKLEVFDDNVEEWEKYTPVRINWPDLIKDPWCKNQIVGHNDNLLGVTKAKNNIINIEVFNHGNLFILED